MHRARLTERLDRARSSGRITLVHAPAGFGKTTLLSQWARQSADPVAWYSLDETDNDLIKFWRYVSQSVYAAVSPGSADRLTPLLRAYPNVSIGGILDALLSGLEEAESPLAVVLDDYQVIADPFIHDSLSYFIDRLPDPVHLVVASRSELPLSTSKWNARGQRHLLTAKQLSFTPEEAREFCLQAAGLTLTDDRIGQLMDWTEGWAASLQLISVSLSEHPNPDVFFDRGRGTNRDLMQYLLDEVFERLPERLRGFLLRTSVLSRFDAEACDAMTDSKDGLRTLDELQRRNLFLTPLDDSGAWFRYHHLFGQFLQDYVRQHEPGLWPDLHRQAAVHLSGRGMPDDAVEHALAAGDHDLAVRLLERHVESVLRRGELATLLRWMQSVPRDAMTHSLATLHAFLLIVTGQIEPAERELARLEREAAEEASGEALRELQSGLFFVKVNWAFASGRYEQWYAYAEQLPGMLPENPIFYHFNYNSNEPFVRRTLFGLRGVQNVETEQIAKRITGIMEAHGWGNALFTLYIIQSLSEGYYEWNRLEDSEALVRRVEPIARRQRIAGLYVPNRLTAARIQWALGQKEAAWAILNEAIEEMRGAGEDEAQWLRPLRAFAAYLHVREGDPARADKELSGLELQPGKISLLRMTEYMALARLLGARRKEKDALRLLDPLRQKSGADGSLIGLVEISALQALLEAQRGHRAAALRHLGEALALSEASGYIRTYLDEGESMQSLLQQYRDLRVKQPSPGEPEAAAPSVGYVERVLAAFPQKEPPASRSARLQEPLSAKERAVLLEAVRGAVNREIAERLHLTEGTVKVYLSRIYAKLGVSTRVQALRRAEELRLFEAD
nr:LuxR C-terminal-related transcriptional regulator [Cohnella zeiphila]